MLTHTIPYKIKFVCIEHMLLQTGWHLFNNFDILAKLCEMDANSYIPEMTNFKNKT